MMFEEERREIDEIDEQIISLLLRRFEVTNRIGNQKKKLGLPVQDSSREKAIVNRIQCLVPDCQQSMVISIYQSIMEQSRQQQSGSLSEFPWLENSVPCCIKQHEMKRYRHFGMMFMKKNIMGRCMDGWFVLGYNHYLSGVVQIDEDMYVASGIRSGRTNIAPYEFLTWVLDQFTSVDQLLKELYRIHLVMTHSTNFPLPKISWIISDRKQCIRLFSTENGMMSEPYESKELMAYFH